jgi:hypothetical protein
MGVADRGDLDGVSRVDMALHLAHGDAREASEGREGELSTHARDADAELGEEASFDEAAKHCLRGRFLAFHARDVIEGGAGLGFGDAAHAWERSRFTVHGGLWVGRARYGERVWDDKDRVGSAAHRVHGGSRGSALHVAHRSNDLSE